MSLNICVQNLDFYDNNVKLLAEKLRKNWLQKLSSFQPMDDSLTSLTWLYDLNPIGLDFDSQHVEDCEPSLDALTADFKYSRTENQPFAGSLFDPQVRIEYRTKWTGKPPFSYATLICLAMRELGKPKVTLSDIYGWIMNNFAYYRHTDSSWQNSVRHNLSLNKCFEKVPRDKGERGKGGFWRVNPRHIDWLEANLAKCRRAAPPPGPPPPMPRSMLLQQRQLQQQTVFQQSFMTSPTAINFQTPFTLSGCPSINTGSASSESSSDLIRTNRIPASSPSSYSSLSSSPLSFNSVGSPANFTCTKASIPTTSRTVSTIPINLTTNSYQLVDSNVTRLHLPAINPTSKTNQSIQPHVLTTHRRKSPLFGITGHSNISQDLANDKLFESDEELNLCKPASLDKVNSHVVGFKSSSKELKRDLPIQPVLKYDSRNDLNSKWRGNQRNNLNNASFHTTHNHFSTPNRPTHLIDDSDLIHKRKSKSNMDNSTLSQTCGSLKRSKSRINPKRGSNYESKILPTRILPPRRRYSRWAHPRPNPPEDTEGSLTLHQQTGNKSVTYTSETKDIMGKLSRSTNHSKTKCVESSKNNLKSLNVVSADENLDDLEDDNDYVWPPLEIPDKFYYGSSEFYHQNLSDKIHIPDKEQYNNLHHAEENSTKSVNIESTSRFTPSYVSSDTCSPADTCSRIQRESNNSSSGCSSSSMQSYFTNHSESHLYNVYSPFDNYSSNSNSSSVRSNYHELEFQTNINDTQSLKADKVGDNFHRTKTELQNSPILHENNIRFDNHLPVSDDTQLFMDVLADKPKMPKWASEMLSSGSETGSDFNQVFTNEIKSSKDSNYRIDNDYDGIKHNLDHDNWSIFRNCNLHISDKLLDFVEDSSTKNQCTESGILENHSIYHHHSHQQQHDYSHEQKQQQNNLSEIINSTLASSSSSSLPSPSITSKTDSTMNVISSNPNLHTSSPFLDDLDLDPVDLNFDSFDELVQSSGPIPLDIDFALTASFNTDGEDTILDTSNSNWNSTNQLDSFNSEWSTKLDSNCYSTSNLDLIQLNTISVNNKNDSNSTNTTNTKTDTMNNNNNNNNNNNSTNWLIDSQHFNPSNSLTLLLNEASEQLFENHENHIHISNNRGNNCNTILELSDHLNTP